MTEHDHDNNKNEDYSPVISDISSSISDKDLFEVLNALESIGFRFPKIINTKSYFISSYELDWETLLLILSLVCSPALHNGQSLFSRILRSKTIPHFLQTCISWLKTVSCTITI